MGHHSCRCVSLEWDDTIRLLKNSLALRKPEGRVKRNSLLDSVSRVFTFITAAYCIIALVLSSAIAPAGGVFFYQSLLVILAITTLIMAVRSIPGEARTNN